MPTYSNSKNNMKNRDLSSDENEMQKILETFIKNYHNVLEVGCGDGCLMRALAKRHPKIKFIGIDKEYSVSLDNYSSTNNLFFQRANITRLPFPNELFDLVISKRTFHFIARKGKAIKEISRVLKRNGLFVMLDFFKTKRIPIKYRFLIFLYWLKKEEPKAFYYYGDIDKIKKIAKKYYFEIIKIKQMKDYCVYGTKNFIVILKKHK